MEKKRKQERRSDSSFKYESPNFKPPISNCTTVITQSNSPTKNVPTTVNTGA